MTREEYKAAAGEIVASIDAALSDLSDLRDEAEDLEDIGAWTHLDDLESALDNARESAFALTGDVWGDEDQDDE